LILKDLEPVEPVLDVTVQGYNMCRIPLPDTVEPLVGGRNQVIERSDSPVTVATHLCIRMTVIIQDLILQADCGTSCSIVFSYEIFDSAVGSLGDHEFEEQVEVSVLFNC